MSFSVSFRQRLLSQRMAQPPTLSADRSVQAGNIKTSQRTIVPYRGIAVQYPLLASKGGEGAFRCRLKATVLDAHFHGHNRQSPDSCSACQPAPGTHRATAVLSGSRANKRTQPFSTRLRTSVLAARTAAIRSWGASTTTCNRSGS